MLPSKPSVLTQRGKSLQISCCFDSEKHPKCLSNLHALAYVLVTFWKFLSMCRLRTVTTLGYGGLSGTMARGKIRTHAKRAGNIFLYRLLCSAQVWMPCYVMAFSLWECFGPSCEFPSHGGSHCIFSNSCLMAVLCNNL
eukprot:scaffold25695_cov21-Prasinocladus_malaysianus.AAC.2